MVFERFGKKPKRYSRRVEELANELGVDLDGVEGSGEGGEITAADVLSVGLPSGDEEAGYGENAGVHAEDDNEAAEAEPYDDSAGAFADWDAEPDYSHEAEFAERDDEATGAEVEVAPPEAVEGTATESNDGSESAVEDQDDAATHPLEQFLTQREPGETVVEDRDDEDTEAEVEVALPEAIEDTATESDEGSTVEPEDQDDEETEESVLGEQADEAAIVPPSAAETAVAGESAPAPFTRWTDELNRYARRLERAHAGTLAGVVAHYAARVEGVQAGRLPPSAATVPAGIEPAMVGEALATGRARRTFELVIEIARNILIFAPVLVAWLKIRTGGGNIDGLEDMVGTALLVVVLISALIGVHVLLGLLRRQTTSRAERISRDFAAALTSASMEASTQQTETAEAAIVAFAKAGQELAESLRDAGDSLAGVKELVTLLRPISQIGTQIEGMRHELSTAIRTMDKTARTLSEIDKNLAPTSESLGVTARKLDILTEQLTQTGKQLDRMAEGFADGGVAMEGAADDFEEAVKALTLIGDRVLKEMQTSDGARSRS